MSIYFNLFMRNWKNGAATEADIEKAVERNLLTQEQAEEIKTTER
ncbi:hypothetical protein RYX45_01530 [Alkalihalophilus pseudofirmus]|uniref:XkdX family protein n=1 Tax=Alkalihalophilus pseudofirmus TaxID=79885 RepID=A0AAJ2KZC0_ALKPS|nr:hypothetical protein [Alkalihalophilus pseudofirmus]MDV2883844.1 hypothetical protein [Alkalihalophilus pseudofirmus]